MAYVKHPTYGNKHVEESEVPALEAEGWVAWPRSIAAQRLGDQSPEAYWKAKYEQSVAALGNVSQDHETPLAVILAERQDAANAKVEDAPVVRNKPGPKPKRKPEA